MRDTPRGIVEELRRAAGLEAVEIGVKVEDLTASEAADYIEHLDRALRRIEAGEADAREIARYALDPILWATRA